MTASHSSGLTLRFDGLPGSSSFGFVPSQVPDETSPAELATLMREGVESFCEACESGGVSASGTTSALRWHLSPQGHGSQAETDAVTKTIDQSYDIIVSYLEQVIIETEADEGRLRASFADPLSLHAVALASGECHDIDIQPQSRPKLVAALERIHSVARGRKHWRQVEFSLNDGQWNMQVTAAK